jgi:hypothetical protein
MINLDDVLDRLDTPDTEHSSGQEKAPTWPEPKAIESELLPVPAFSESLLPKSLCDFVLDEADRMPCPPDYIAAALIVSLGSVIGASCAVKPKRRDDSWLVTANLWGGVVGEPSSKKTPAIGVAMKNLDRLEAASAEKLEAEQSIYEAELAAHKAHESAVLAAMKKAATSKSDPTERSERMDSAKHDMATLQEPEKPHQRRFKSNDGTVEKLGDLLVSNPDGLLVLRDELIGLLASWDKEGKEGDRAFYLEAWNGTGNFNIDRIARGSLFVPNLCLSVFGGIQPDLLEKYLSNITNSFDNDGRVQRFQVLVYPDATAWAWRDRIPAKDPRIVVRNIFSRLADFDPVMDGAKPADEFVKLPHFSFDDAAQEIFIEWCQELNGAGIANEGNPLIRQHLAKYEKLFCSLALIFHLAEGKIGDISADSALRAAAYCEYLEGHARRIYGLVEAAKVTSAQTLGRRLAEGKMQSGFTARDVRRKRWSGLGSTSQVEAALDILEDAKWLRGFETAGIEGGRPTTTYTINPHVFSNKAKGE